MQQIIVTRTPAGRRMQIGQIVVELTHDEAERLALKLRGGGK